MKKFLLIILLWAATALYSQDLDKLSQDIQQEIVETTQKTIERDRFLQHPGYWTPIFKVSQRFQALYSFDLIKNPFLLSTVVLDIQFGRYQKGFFLIRLFAQFPLQQTTRYVLQQPSLGYGVGGGGYIIDQRKWNIDDKVYKGAAVSLVGVATSSYGLPTSYHNNYLSDLNMNGGELNLKIEYFFSTFFHMYIGFDVGVGGYNFKPSTGIEVVNGYIFYGGSLGFGF